MNNKLLLVEVMELEKRRCNILKSVDGHKNRREGKKSVRRWNTRDKNLQKNDKFFWELLDTGGKNHDSKKNTRDHAVTEF